MNLPPLDPKSSVQILRGIVQNPIGLFSEALNKYGETYRVNIFKRQYFVATNPDFIQHVLQTKSNNYVKSQKVVMGYKQAVDAWGENILTTKDPVYWNQCHRAAVPSFVSSLYDNYADIISKNVLELCDEWDKRIINQSTIDIYAEMKFLTYKLLFSTIIKGTNVELKQASTISNKWIDMFGLKLNSLNPLTWIFPSKIRSQFQAAKKNYNELMMSLVMSRLNKDEDPENFIDYFVKEFKDEKNKDKYHRILRDNVGMLVIAGHETTANVLSWILIYLSLYPAVKQKVQDELEQVLKNKPMTYQDINSLPYTRSVIKEVLRLRSPGEYSFRITLENDEACGYSIPKDTTIIIPTYFIHRNPNYWENPEGFSPERFLGKEYGQDHRFAYIPFLAGTRGCLGSSFAMLEMMLTIPILLKRFNFALLPGFQNITAHKVTLVPKNGLRMKVTSHSV